jgi:hypothetical protein
MTHCTPREQLQHYVRAPLAPQLVYIAVKLGVPDRIGDGALSSIELAQQTGAHAPSLHRVLRGNELQPPNEFGVCIPKTRSKVLRRTCHLVTLSSCHRVILSPCHRVIVSSCHIKW